MGMRILGVFLLVIALATGLGVACGEGEPEEPLVASDELRAQIVEAMRPPGRILHIKGRVGESDWIDENPHTFEIWLDGDGDRFRSENRREWLGGSAMGVVVGVGWEMTVYSSDANLVSERSIPTEYQARLRDPAAFAVGYLWALTMADEWQILEEKTEGGRTIVVIEARGVEGRDVDPETVPVTVVELDKDTLWPVRQSDRNILAEGEIEESALYLFDVVELLSPKDVPDDLFSREAVESLYVTMEEKLEEARAQGFALYWVGERYVADADRSGLVLRDLGVTQSVPWRVWLSYSLEGEWIDSVTIYEGPGSWSPKAADGPSGYSRRDVVVQGVTGVLHISDAALDPTFPSQVPTFPWHSLVLSLGGTTIELATAPAVKDGQDMNAFNNPEALLSLAEALVVAE
jgi:hypothetical protein